MQVDVLNKSGKATGRTIELPDEIFGIEPNDLALDAMTITIEATLREMLGEPAYPPPPEPVNCVLI